MRNVWEYMKTADFAANFLVPFMWLLFICAIGLWW